MIPSRANIRGAASFASFAEFWPFYVSQHVNRTNRKLHFVGTTGVLVFALLGLLGIRRLWLAIPLAGYGPAWLGHWLFEKNRPATFSYPFWSILGDFQMYWLTLTGRMDAVVEEVERDLSRGA